MTSILNDVLGPVMRGPSSSHTAAPYHIATVARHLLGAPPVAATFTFDPGGSFAEVYRQQGSALGFAAGLLDEPLTSEGFHQMLDLAARRDPPLALEFRVEPLPRAEHPNTIDIRLESGRGPALHAVALSTGGGTFVFTELDGWAVRLTGDAHEVVVCCEAATEGTVASLLAVAPYPLAPLERSVRGDLVLLHQRWAEAPEAGLRARLESKPGVRRVRLAPPVFYVQRSAPPFASGAEMAAWAGERGGSLGQAALAYESTLLGLSEGAVIEEVARRARIMRAAVERGLESDPPPMQLLAPSAGAILRAEAAGRLAVGGLHTRAAARAMAVMHVNGGMGVVCAAPTAGAAGVLPGVVVTLAQERDLDEATVARLLLAAGAVGVVLGTRATFAAEIAGCQVEIAASGAMAAAAVVEAAGGVAEQALDAAAISFQNTMGLICDPVQGIVEIPCHTRNAVAASSAFVCADLVLGGYHNPIPLDETVDAVLAVGRMLPRELKCTALGGLSLAPSALAMERRR